MPLLFAQIKDVVFNDVPVRLFYPQTRKADEGAVMWFHGGGWVISSVGKISNCAIILLLHVSILSSVVFP